MVFVCEDPAAHVVVDKAIEGSTLGGLGGMMGISTPCYVTRWVIIFIWIQSFLLVRRQWLFFLLSFLIMSDILQVSAWHHLSHSFHQTQYSVYYLQFQFFFSTLQRKLGLPVKVVYKLSGTKMDPGCHRFVGTDQGSSFFSDFPSSLSWFHLFLQFSFSPID